MVKPKTKTDTYEVVDGVVVEGFMDAEFDSNEWAGRHLIYLSRFEDFCDGDIREKPEDVVETLSELLLFDGDWDDFYEMWRRSHQEMSKEVDGIAWAWKNLRKDLREVSGGVDLGGVLDRGDKTVVAVKALTEFRTDDMIRKTTRKDHVDVAVKDVVWLLREQIEAETFMGEASVQGKASLMDAFIGSLIRKKLMVDKLIENLDAWAEWFMGSASQVDPTVVGKYEELKAKRWEHVFGNLQQAQERKIHGRPLNESRGPKHEASKM